jgi:6-methylsalicylate decarboxylase
VGRCIYGANCGVPCSTEDTMEENRTAVLEVEEREVRSKGVIGENDFNLFPTAAKRAGRRSVSWLYLQTSPLECGS